MKPKHLLIVGTLFVVAGLWLGTCAIGCNSNEQKTENKIENKVAPVIEEKPKVVSGNDNSKKKIEVNTVTETKTEHKSEQHSNNVWPWMIALIIIGVSQPLLFLTFLYFSNSWKGKRGL